jgi:predicted metal-dependent phosphoesterase TrpH
VRSWLRSPRWATRRSRETGLIVGPGGAEVLFDPMRPDDEKSVFVALRRHPLADWLPAR